jgi:hypothetical protein
MILTPVAVRTSRAPHSACDRMPQVPKPIVALALAMYLSYSLAWVVRSFRLPWTLLACTYGAELSLPGEGVGSSSTSALALNHVNLWEGDVSPAISGNYDSAAARRAKAEPFLRPFKGSGRIRARSRRLVSG